MSFDMSQFFQVFFDETEELLAEKEKLLLEIDLESPDPEEIDAIFRAAHSIKGGSATFGLKDMTEVTHILENLLDMIRKQEIKMTAEHVDAFLAAKDVLLMMRDGHRDGTQVDQGAVTEVLHVLQTLYDEASGKSPAGGGVVGAASVQPTKAQAESAPASESAIPASSGQKRHYRIELPEVSAKDVQDLEIELKLLGELESIQLDGGRKGFKLSTEESANDIEAICSFIIDTSDLKIFDEAAVSDPATERNGYRKLRFELPEAAEKDVDALEVELKLLGGLERIQLKNGRTGFYLLTEESLDDILSICSFVVDPDELIITEEAVPVEEVAKDQEEIEGFGLFEPLDSPVQGVPEKTDEAFKVEVLPEPDTSTPVTPAPAKAPTKAAERTVATQESTSIRVSVEKVDQLINLVGELVITQAMVEQRSSDLDPMTHERLLSSVSQLARNTRDLQEAVMSIRMMPMDYVFSRFPRMVRDLAGKLGKKIDFVTKGAATELDKGLIERIIDPLTHLVRNSVDHGIERPEIRVASGKSESGKLTLSAAHQGGNIVIEVVDDGGGLDRDRIMSKAAEKGIPVSENMSDSEVWQLIFAPGFSTAEAVTDVSGRGVGMDVVKRNISAMGGIVDIRSEKSVGTTISISLPLTLAILDGMSIKVGNEIYILPLGFVIESLKPSGNDIKEIANQGRVVKVRGEYLPLIPLYQLFNIDPVFTNPSDGIVVILETDGMKAALFIDEMLGQQQVVVKNLESNYKKVHGISGATILGDGGVALIIDVSAIVRSSRWGGMENMLL